MTLNSRCATAARRALRVVPMEASMAVMHVPMSMPTRMGSALPKVTCPVVDSACRIPTEAELDWMMHVSTRPANMPNSGLENISSTFWKAGASRRPATAADMVSMPNISVAKPSRIKPVLVLAAFAHHVQDHAGQRQQGREGRGLEQLEEDIRAADAAQAEDPGGHGGADVGADDDVDGLPQRHQTGVDKADDHDRRGRGALDDGGDAQTRQKAEHALIGELAEQNLQAAAGALFQCGAHQVHAEQKQAQSAEQREKIK